MAHSLTRPISAQSHCHSCTVLNVSSYHSALGSSGRSHKDSDTAGVVWLACIGSTGAIGADEMASGGLGPRGIGYR